VHEPPELRFDRIERARDAGGIRGLGGEPEDLGGLRGVEGQQARTQHRESACEARERFQMLVSRGFSHVRRKAWKLVEGIQRDASEWAQVSHFVDEAITIERNAWSGRLGAAGRWIWRAHRSMSSVVASRRFSRASDCGPAARA